MDRNLPVNRIGRCVGLGDYQWGSAGPYCGRWLGACDSVATFETRSRTIGRMIERIPTPFRIAAAAAWTVLLIILMLSPGRETFAVDLSSAFGGTELTDAIGHLFLAFVETLLIYGALRPFLSAQRAIVLTAVITVLLGAVLETAQLWVPFRGANLLDFVAHTVGVVVAIAGLWVQRRIVVR